MSHEHPFQLGFIAMFAVLGWIRAYSFGRARSAEEVTLTEEGSFKYLRVIFGLPLIIGAFTYMIAPEKMVWSQIDLPNAVRWCGIATGIASLYGLVWVHEHLARNFTPTVFVRSENTLVTTGPYAYVRHPMYIFFLLYCLSVFLLTASWFLGGGLAFVIVYLMIFRTPIEERKLIERHGDVYREYMKRTGRYFPRWN